AIASGIKSTSGIVLAVKGLPMPVDIDMGIGERLWFRGGSGHLVGKAMGLSGDYSLVWLEVRRCMSNLPAIYVKPELCMVPQHRVDGVGANWFRPQRLNAVEFGWVKIAPLTRYVGAAKGSKQIGASISMRALNESVPITRFWIIRPLYP